MYALWARCMTGAAPNVHRVPWLSLIITIKSISEQHHVRMTPNADVLWFLERDGLENAVDEDADVAEVDSSEDGDSVLRDTDSASSHQPQSSISNTAERAARRADTHQQGINRSLRPASS